MFTCRPLPLYFLLLFLCLALGRVPAAAQDTVTGAFEGTVTDSQTGTPLAAAQVEITNQSTGQTFTRTTDARGRFFQGLLAPALYRIRVTATGYQTREVLQNLKISFAGEVVPVPVALDPAGVAPATSSPTPGATPVLGVADSDLRASVGGNDGARRGSFSAPEATALPLGGTTGTRSFDELATLLPGVVPPPQTAGRTAGPGQGPGVGTAGQFAVNGLRSRANNFTVDGSDNNDEDIGVRRQGFVALVPQPIESIQEYQIITLLAPAQYGRNLGAQVNAVSRSGGNDFHGTLYGYLNATPLNARNFFDSTNGTATTPLTASGKPVLFSGRQITTTNQSGGEDSFTLGQGGFVFGGPLTPARKNAFFFVALEHTVQNATREGNFAVPTVEQRGLRGSGATGLANDPLTGLPLRNCSTAPGGTVTGCGFPATVTGDAVFSIFPFANNPNGLYGANTFTQTLPDDARSTIFSGKIDYQFSLAARPQSFTARYNFTQDRRDIGSVGGAIFASLRPRTRTQNLSTFLNSQLRAADARASFFNQLRASYGRTRLVFDELRDTQFLLPSAFANQPNGQFLLNAPVRVNNTLPNNSANVVYSRFFNFTTEDLLGPVGQVDVAGFSPVGTDVFNFPQRRVNNTYQLADALTIQAGQHNLGFGADFRRADLNSALARNSRRLLTFYGGPTIAFTPTGTVLSGFFSPLDLVAASAPSGVLQTVSPAGTSESISLRYYQTNFYAQDAWRVRPNFTLSYGLRYEYNTPPREVDERIERTFNDPNLSLVPGLRTFLAGRTQIFDADRNNFAPRLGLAYAPRWFGANRYTVLRAGAGIYYDQALGAVVSQSRNVFPNFLTLNLAGQLRFDGAGFVIGNPAQPFFPCGTSFQALLQANTVNTLNPAVSLACLAALNNSAGNNTFPAGFGFTLPARKLPSPAAGHYGVTLEQQLAANLFVSIGYVGTQGRHLLRQTTPNLGVNAVLVPRITNVLNNEPNISGLALGPGQNINALGQVVGGRPVANTGAVVLYEASANSRYDAVQLQVRGRFSRALDYRLSYTYSRAEDEASDVFDLAGASALPQNSLTRSGERARANFDVPHRVTYIVGYDLGGVGRNFLLRDLQITSTGRWQSGQPFTVNSIFDVNLDGNLTDRLDNFNGLRVTGNRQRPLELTGSATSLLAAVGQDGRIGRNSFRAGSVLELDLSVLKAFRLRGEQRLQVRLDVFNLTNRDNFGVPVRYLGAAGFGQAMETVTPARRLQVAIKYLF